MADSYMAGDDKNKDVLFSLILQRHRLNSLRRLILDTSSRIACIAVAGFLALVGHLSYTALAAVVLTAFVVLAVWVTGRDRLSREVVDLEHAIARSSGGDLQDLYITTNQAYSGYWRLSVSGREPQLWFVALVSILLVDILTRGVGHWAGFGGS